MTSSADFQAYSQAESEQQQRLARVYQALESDPGLATEHFLVEHLPELLAGTLSVALRSHFAKEYHEIRATVRALAVTGLLRQDFYAHATHVAMRKALFYKDVLALYEAQSTRALQAAPADFQDDLQQKMDEAATAKGAVGLRIRVAANIPEGVDIQAKDTIRASLQTTGLVNVRGVSTEATKSDG